MSASTPAVFASRPETKKSTPRPARGTAPYATTPITGDVESGLAYTSVSRSMTAATCPEGHDCASERWAPDEPPGDEEDEVLAHASADARANTPIHLMAYPPKPW